MKKIMPAVIVTAAAVAAAVTYIKRRIDKQNKVNFIEVEIKPEKTVKHTLKKVGDVAENIVSVGKEILIETVDTVGDVVETFIEDPTDFGEIFDEIKEGYQEIQEIIAESKDKGDDEVKEAIDKEQDNDEEIIVDELLEDEKQEEVVVKEDITEEEIVENQEIEEETVIENEVYEDEIVEPIEELFNKNEAEEEVPQEEVDEFLQTSEESEGVVEQALLINDIVADIITEEEKLINEAITQEIEQLIDEVVEEEIIEPELEEIVFEESEEEISIDEIMQEVVLQAEQEHIEEVLSATMDDIPLEPIDLQPGDDETVLKVVDETVGEINLINDIIESLEDDDSVEESIEDLEDIVETAIYEEPVVVDDSLLTEEQFLDRCIGLYTGIKENKIRLIIKQVGVMLDTIEVTETINLQHFATFESIEDKERYANIAAIEGHHVLHSDKENELIILNTLDSDRISLCKSILQLAQDLTEYNGLYKGWTVS